MLGQTYSQGQVKPNNNLWGTDNPLRLEFEEFIYNILSKELEPYYNQGTIIHATSSSRDHGKDIIIESMVTLENILGQNFIISDGIKAKVYIECKSSEHEKIRYNDFAGNLERIRNDNIQYYVLVTNTTIVPFSYYSFSEALRRENIEFILIDQYLLLDHLNEIGENLGTPIDLEKFEDIYIEYQPNSCMIEMQNAYELYLWIRNYSLEAKQVSLFLETDRNWIISQNNIDNFIEPRKSECLKLILKKQYFDGINDLSLNVCYNNKSTSIQIKGMNISYNFVPPLVGVMHKQVIDSLVTMISNSEENNIHFILGEAGVGKTRILDELISKLLGKNYTIYNIICEKNKSTLIKLQDELKKNNKRGGTYSSLIDYTAALDAKYRKQVIIIDDLHNADPDFFNDIRDILKSDLPSGISIIFVGRNDYSAGNMEYFSFLQYCGDTYNNKVHNILPLENAEANLLIKSIVKGIPGSALEKIFNLSNNNPLFIIQTIEYMLDLKLVYLLNRTTVGIDNPDSFSAHFYIPKSINEIYVKRLDSLSQLENGKALVQFLYIAASIGVAFPDYLVETFFEGKESLLEILIQRRYLAEAAEGYIFTHESLYLFVHRQLLDNASAKMKAGKWLTNTPVVYEHLDLLKKGQLYLWSEDVKNAQKCFQEALASIQNIRNYSSININSGYYEYMEELYNICDSYEGKKQVIAGKIYIALHYHTPYEAINACEWARKQLALFPQSKKDSRFQFFLTEQMAHSYLNAGQMQKSELLLHELLSKVMIDEASCEPKAVFDMYDKLSSIYIKYNCFSVAKNYCEISLNYSKKLKDKNLEALSYISFAKLYFYRDKKKSKKYLLSAQSLLFEEEAYRIKCHNDVSLIIMDLYEAENMAEDFLKNLMSKAYTLLKICVENSFASSVIRLYILLAAIYYMLGIKNKNYQLSQSFAEKGIDASVKFGISTYIWQCYNLLALVTVQQEKPIKQQESMFNTVYNILRRQNLTYLGMGDLTYGNVLALSNIAMFYQKNTFESAFQKKVSQITFWNNINSCDFECNKSSCQYQCHSSLELITNEWKKINKLKQKQYLIFDIKTESYLLQDSNGYYIILS